MDYEAPIRMRPRVAEVRLFMLSRRTLISHTARLIHLEQSSRSVKAGCINCRDTLSNTALSNRTASRSDPHISMSTIMSELANVRLAIGLYMN